MILKKLKVVFFSLKKIVHKLRLIKDKSEINLIRTAGKISSLAHIEMIKKCKPGLTERELEAVLLYNFNTRPTSTKTRIETQHC